MANLSALFLAFFALAIASSTASREPFRASAGQQGLCNMNQTGLDACKPYIMGPTPTEKPTDVCCEALSHADLNCLCSYKNSGWLTFLRIDPERAMQLPAKCNMTPPAKC